MVKFCSIFSAYLLGALERCGASYAYHECYAQYGPRSFLLQKCFKSIQRAPRPELFCTLNPKRNDWICHILLCTRLAATYHHSVLLVAAATECFRSKSFCKRFGRASTKLSLVQHTQNLYNLSQICIHPRCSKSSMWFDVFHRV